MLGVRCQRDSRTHLPSSHDVNVQVVDRLRAVLPIVDDQTVTIGLQTSAGCHFGRSDHEFAEQGLVPPPLRILDHREVRRLWDHQRVEGSLRVDICKGEALLILRGRESRAQERERTLNRVCGSSKLLFTSKRIFAGISFRMIFPNIVSPPGCAD